MHKIPTPYPMFAATLAVGLLASFGIAQGQTTSPTPTVPGTTQPAPLVTPARPGTATIPDGAPGNPPGTAVGRAIDRATTTTPSATTATPVAANAAIHHRPRASQLIGANIYNDRDERVGEIEDLVLTATGDRPMAIVQVGGFLGIGGRLIAMPLNDLSWNAQNERIILPGATKEALQARPAFTYEAIRRG